MCSSLGYAPGLAHKHQTRLERLARDKHSSLLRSFTNYRLKKFKKWALSNCAFYFPSDVPLLTPLGYRTSQACRVLPVHGAFPVRDKSGHVGRHQAPPGAKIIKLFTAVIYNCSQYARRAFVLGKPSILVKCQWRRLGQRTFFTLGQSLGSTHKHQTRLKKLAKGQTLQLIINIRKLRL